MRVIRAMLCMPRLRRGGSSTTGTPPSRRTRVRRGCFSAVRSRTSCSIAWAASTCPKPSTSESGRPAATAGVRAPLPEGAHRAESHGVGHREQRRRVEAAGWRATELRPRAMTMTGARVHRSPRSRHRLLGHLPTHCIHSGLPPRFPPATARRRLSTTGQLVGDPIHELIGASTAALPAGTHSSDASLESASPSRCSMPRTDSRCAPRGCAFHPPLAISAPHAATKRMDTRGTPRPRVRASDGTPSHHLPPSCRTN
ncbi:hypothetical protein FHX44_11806 [Pseudonocardia hierapolitana]|uniref:Uncharacterized protein n=1 Tax=Pseudonocardia hierapolitana TaxID=1128676 RepID=A0A561SJC6_9PSEU|nr:hypothetical protein FHX44_11806 [Pseudonocardia hierapolitana]